MQTFPLTRIIQVLFFFFLVFTGLYFAKPFLVPVTIAGILAMLFLPLSRWLEGKGISKGLSAIACILVLIGVIAGVISLLSWQISDLSEDMTGIQEKVSGSISNLKGYISTKLGISPEKQQEMLKQQQSSGGGGAGKVVTAIISSFSGLLVDTVLVFVYIFLFMFFRNHLKQFILKLVSPEQKDKTLRIIHDTCKVSQQYLSGLAMMIVILWIMYGIGFSIVGVKHAIFFAILCGILEIVPFVGNLTGTGLTVLMALSQGGGSSIVIGVLVTYALVQFIQTYILEPLVVGSEVNLNPLFTIIAIVVGEMVWGVPGMILAIPLMGITKVICDNIDALKPYGFLIGEEKKNDKGEGFKEKIKGLFK